MNADRVTAPGGLSCRELVELVTDYLEGLLDVETERRFEAHLVGCDGCTGYLAQMRETLDALGSLRADDIAPRAREALLKAFHKWHKS